MAVSEIDKLRDPSDWYRPIEKPHMAELASSVVRFFKKKPLGAFCGLIILFFVVIGDLVPESINKTAQVTGLGETPAPYLADVLADNVSFIHRYERQDLRNQLAGPSKDHILGTDSLGRDIFSRLLYGSRIAVLVAFGATLISVVIQLIINVPAGFYGGWYDKIVYRLVDVVDSLPTLVILLVVLGVFGSGLWQMVGAIGVLSGFGGRALRGQTISIMTSPFIEAARVAGVSDKRMMLRYILPNLMPLVILGASLRLGTIVLLEASLSFLGYGLPPPFPSWGQMLSLEGRAFMREQPGLALYPGIAIGLLVFSFNLWGDALRDVLDPRLRGSK